MIEFHKKWITNSCLIIKENCQKINMLDQEIGDGDHGTTILRGLEEAVSHFSTNNEFNNSISFDEDFYGWRFWYFDDNLL